jgi:methylmalonyl-CoA mutase C-terminal domain/subunit
LRDAGMEVIYSGLFCTPEKVAKIAIEEDVDIVAMSLLKGVHLTLFPKVKSALNKKGAKNILVIGGGIIPQKDKKLLKKQGVYGNFGPDTSLAQIIDFIRNNVNNK